MSLVSNRMSGFEAPITTGTEVALMRQLIDFRGRKTTTPSIPSVPRPKTCHSHLQTSDAFLPANDFTQRPLLTSYQPFLNVNLVFIGFCTFARVPETSTALGPQPSRCRYPLQGQGFCILGTTYANNYTSNCCVNRWLKDVASYYLIIILQEP